VTDVPTTPRKPMSRMRRLRIFERDKGVCCLCSEKIDGVREPWTIEHKIALALGGEDADENCGPAHESCRRAKDKVDVPMIAKAKRMKARHLGIRKRSSFPCGRGSKWKQKVGGRVVLR
jgi:5-methylcytosine-specific restriction protein A